MPRWQAWCWSTVRRNAIRSAWGYRPAARPLLVAVEDTHRSCTILIESPPRCLVGPQRTPRPRRCAGAGDALRCQRCRRPQASHAVQVDGPAPPRSRAWGCRIVQQQHVCAGAYGLFSLGLVGDLDFHPRYALKRGWLVPRVRCRRPQRCGCPLPSRHRPNRTGDCAPLHDGRPFRARGEGLFRVSTTRKRPLAACTCLAVFVAYQTAHQEV